MKRTIATGAQSFERIREENCFYVDKTSFIRDWWEGGDDVTLLTRPRRFGKTLGMNMMDCFFSKKYAGRGDLFEGLNIWKVEKYRQMQGTWPVIFLTFAGIKGTSYASSVIQMKKEIVRLFARHDYLYEAECFTQNEVIALRNISEEMSEEDTAYSLNLLSLLMEKYYGKKVLIFLDEYDTPLQEAYIGGYWDELVTFIRTMFNNTFKTNPSLHRAIMTGITRVGKESIFSDLNNLTVASVSSDLYASSFGFTEEETFAALDEYGCSEEEKRKVKDWYDGFIFGHLTDIYNPWSVTSFLNERKFKAWWGKSSGNGLAKKLVQEGDPDLKMDFERLLQGGTIEKTLDEEIVYNQLDDDSNAVWSLLLATGYLKADVLEWDGEDDDDPVYCLTVTNRETRNVFRQMIRGWFRKNNGMSRFMTAMLKGDVCSMNRFLGEIALNTFSFFDTGKGSGKAEPEKFYHGFVLGLLVEQVKDYHLRSNRESGFGRYDVVMEPVKPANAQTPAVILEFKVYDKEEGEQGLEDTAENALRQIEEKRYDSELLARGIPLERILKYGVAFCGKECLIRKG